jgi:hypothetical protein
MAIIGERLCLILGSAEGDFGSNSVMGASEIGLKNPGNIGRRRAAWATD